MPLSLDKVEKDLKTKFKDTKGVTISRRDTPKFTEDQKKRIRLMKARLRALLGDK